MFSVNSQAKIWKTYDKGNYTECDISTSVMRKDTQSYEKDFSARVRFVAKAHNQRPMAGQKIKIINCGVTNNYDKVKKILYTNYVVFDYELIGEQKEPAPSLENLQPVDEGDLPF